jgi:molybdopterin synthase catalytic subunit
MLLVYSLLAAALLGASDVTTQQALPQETFGSVCKQDNSSTEQGAQDAQAFVGIVREVDYNKGLVTIDTDAGKLEAAASLEDIVDLHEGDILILCATEKVPAKDPVLKEPFIT